MASGIVRETGFTLVEIAVVIVALGIIAAVAIPKFGSLSESAKITATKSELQSLKRAIVGNPQIIAGGRYTDVGFEGDVGHPPVALTELGRKPDTVAAYDRFSRAGWNGPYIDTGGGEYLLDAWGVTYLYNHASRTVRSVGGPDTITISF